jgi:hypothetical protein
MEAAGRSVTLTEHLSDYTASLPSIPQSKFRSYIHYFIPISFLHLSVVSLYSAREAISEYELYQLIRRIAIL